MNAQQTILHSLFLPVCCWILSATVSFAEEASTLWIVDEPRIEARLTAIQDHRISFKTASGPRDLQLDRIVNWGWWKDNPRGPQIVLQDGSVLIGDPLAMRPRDITVATEPFGELTLPRESVAGVIFRPPTDLIERDRLRRELVETKRTEESVRMFNSDELDGLAISPSDSPAGMPLATLQIGPNNTAVSTENVVAIKSRRILVNAGEPPLWIGLRDGTRLALSEWKVADTQLEFRTQAGISIRIAAGNFWPQVTWVQRSGTTFSFLSDQKPAGLKHIGLLSTTWELGVDRNVLGGALRTSGHIYEKGLGMHSTASAAYNLAGKFHWFDADIAVDDEAQSRGSVVFRVFIDRVAAGQPSQWKQAYESPIVRGGMLPIPVHVDVSGVERLALIVESADRGDECDYANWLLARLIP